MLRVLEDVISKNPEIIFIGATNFLELVDDAAKRPGRFGVKLKIEKSKVEDVREILKGVFDLLDIDSDMLAKSNYFKTLESECCGMLAFSIQNAITNAYLTSEFYEEDEPSIDKIVNLFIDSIKYMKKITRFDDSSDVSSESVENKTLD